MYDTEELGLSPEDMHIVNVNGTAVPAFEYAERMWYQLAALFRALELQEAGYGGLSARAGNLICDSGEALKYKDTWYGTIKGLHMFADCLYKDQCLYVNSIYEETAGIRYQAIMQWLSSLDDGSDAPGTVDGNGTVEQAPKNGMEYKSRAILKINNNQHNGTRRSNHQQKLGQEQSG